MSTELQVVPEVVRAFTVSNAPALDPITVILQDVGPGAGRLIVECYGRSWAGYWGAMGSRNVARFVSECDPDYIAGKMERDRMKKSERAHLLRIVQAVHAALNQEQL